MKKAMALAALLAAAGAAQGAVRISEFLINPPSTDNGQEFFELCGDMNESLSGLWFLVIEGDSTGAGVVDQAFNLSSFSLGSNGLFLWRDSATVLEPAPDAATTLNVADFSPDIENGTNTFLLVSNFTGSVGGDLDAGNDGTLDSAPWGSVIDSVGYGDGGASDWIYSSNFAVASGGFEVEAYALGTDGVGYFLDITAPDADGPYAIDNSETVPGGVIGSFTLTPGSKNTIPAPGALALLALGGMLGARRRRA